jgi:hypothetical protein
MEGPAFYSRTEDSGKKISQNAPWDVRGITNGLVYERVDSQHQDMDYAAIDLDRHRIFYHDESGGFPPDEYQPNDEAKR